MGRTGLFIILVLLAFHETHANEADSTRGEFIESYSQYFFIGPLFKKNNLDFDIFSADDVKKSYTFRANHSFSLGFNVNLFDVNLGIVFAMPLETKSDLLYGASEVSDLQLTAISRRWFADVYFQRYDGFYVQSPDVVIPTGQPFPQRADLVTQNLGMSFAYVFNNNKFSLKAPYLFSERQKVSKGSFLLSSVLSSFTMAADSALIPSVRWKEWGPGASVNEVRFTSLGLAPGYSHTFVVKKFFLNMTLALGPAHYWVRYKEMISREQNDIRVDLYSLARIGIGFNGDRFFSGISVTSQSRSLTYERTTFQNSISTVRVVAGFRFLEEGFLKKKAIDLIPVAF